MNNLRLHTTLTSSGFKNWIAFWKWKATKSKRKIQKKVLEMVNGLIEDSDSKKTTKAILKTFVDWITFDKESKSNFKIYMTFDQVVIDRLNEFMSSESTANSTAVGSFILPKILKLSV